MRAMLLLVLTATVTLAADGRKDDKVKEELKKLNGTWVVDSAMVDGEGIGSELNWEWIFAGDKLTRQNPRDGATQKFTCKVDPSASPKAFDLIEDKEVAFRCIFEIKGDTLRICINRKQSERPTEFTDQGCALVVLKRPKP